MKEHILIIKIYLKELFHTIFWKTERENVINPKYDGYQRGLTSMVYKYFDKKTGSEYSLCEI